MDMEPFIKLFFAVDKDETEDITINELEQYVRQNDLDDALVSRWSMLFDPQNTGHITLEKMCEVLGLKQENILKMRHSVPATPKHLHPDIVVLNSHMNLSDQIKISEEARRLAIEHEIFNPDEANEQLKRWLDLNFTPTWQVVLIKGSHWITFSYCPKSSFQFRLYDYTYLIWRTPQLEFHVPKQYASE